MWIYVYTNSEYSRARIYKYRGERVYRAQGKLLEIRPIFVLNTSLARDSRALRESTADVYPVIICPTLSLSLTLAVVCVL